eukprot:15794145-Heterocapsa_arctica.AAC.1
MEARLALPRAPGRHHEGRLPGAHLPALPEALRRASRPEAGQHHGGATRRRDVPEAAGLRALAE